MRRAGPLVPTFLETPPSPSVDRADLRRYFEERACRASSRPRKGTESRLRATGPSDHASFGPHADIGPSRKERPCPPVPCRPVPASSSSRSRPVSCVVPIERANLLPPHASSRHHPRWKGRPLQAVLDRPLALADAQLVLAREYGFDNWARLKRHVETAGRLAAFEPHPAFDDAVAALRFRRSRAAARPDRLGPRADPRPHQSRAALPLLHRRDAAPSRRGESRPRPAPGEHRRGRAAAPGRRRRCERHDARPQRRHDDGAAHHQQAGQRRRCLRAADGPAPGTRRHARTEEAGRPGRPARQPCALRGREDDRARRQGGRPGRRGPGTDGPAAARRSTTTGDCGRACAGMARR